MRPDAYKKKATRKHKAKLKQRGETPTTSAKTPAGTSSSKRTARAQVPTEPPKPSDANQAESDSEDSPRPSFSRRAVVSNAFRYEGLSDSGGEEEGTGSETEAAPTVAAQGPRKTVPSQDSRTETRRLKAHEAARKGSASTNNPPASKYQDSPRTTPNVNPRNKVPDLFQRTQGLSLNARNRNNADKSDPNPNSRQPAPSPQLANTNRPLRGISSANRSSTEPSPFNSMPAKAALKGFDACSPTLRQPARYTKRCIT
ncbi:hypothetical protein H4R33_000003 [Dimargaris cristalligena]|uniref:Uncharacterized protein n=1 Tax=Dimargaris cristalligena TaxID=215637 RepID=A0A4P9ZWH9_9FUNG|nr:hypothetical protein H4R33_000003 [Dimargaris cristalligena]RKP37678.1 hypothetical protein BJ085DRAFT_37186 [Dimargaris cristalligena]|eukprot:RKP37678.1 hypothetical protein BJ085DRAFT_37186 [Dimargaris cristalligena]